MEKESNEVREFLAKKGKAVPSKSGEKTKIVSSRASKSSLVKIAGFVKKWGYKLAKFAAFTFFVYKVEHTFSRMRHHISRNGGVRREAYGGYRPY